MTITHDNDELEERPIGFAIDRSTGLNYNKAHIVEFQFGKSKPIQLAYLPEGTNEFSLHMDTAGAELQFVDRKRNFTIRLKEIE